MQCERLVTNRGTQRAERCKRRATVEEHGTHSCTQHSVAATLERRAKRESELRKKFGQA